MSAIRNVAQTFRNLWGQGGDEYEDEEDIPSFRSSEAQSSVRQEEDEPHQAAPSRYTTPSSMRREESHREDEDEYPAYTQPPRSDYSSASTSSTTYGSGTSGGASSGRRLRPVAMPIRGREKNVYTLKPKSMDEASVAADYLKTGCAVILNLDDLSKGAALRMVDFMSGVCYGLDNQGHAMKLGATIFLFTPGDYEITSDEADYGENREPIFRDETHDASPSPRSEAPSAAPTAPMNERRSWER
ncbi:cell division protein SepF [Abditibacteriota bacterium]|nr:cell division protein SepF [Abditibacteriota bacterium]